MKGLFGFRRIKLAPGSSEARHRTPVPRSSDCRRTDPSIFSARAPRRGSRDGRRFARRVHRRRDERHERGSRVGFAGEAAVPAEQRLRHRAAAFALRGGGGSLALEIFHDPVPLSSALPAAGLPEIFAGTFIAFPSLPKSIRLEGRNRTVPVQPGIGASQNARLRRCGGRCGPAAAGSERASALAARPATAGSGPGPAGRGTASAGIRLDIAIPNRPALDSRTLSATSVFRPSACSARCAFATPVSVAAFPEPTRFGPLRRSPSHGHRDRPPPDGGLPCRRVRGRFAFPSLPALFRGGGAEAGGARGNRLGSRADQPHAASRFPARSRRPISRRRTRSGARSPLLPDSLGCGPVATKQKPSCRIAFAQRRPRLNSGPAHPSTEKFHAPG